MSLADAVRCCRCDGFTGRAGASYCDDCEAVLVNERSAPKLLRAEILRIVRRWRRREEYAELSVHGAVWHSVAEIRRAAMPNSRRSDNHAVRGILIELVVAGEVEAKEFANGVFWRSSRPVFLEGFR